MSVAEWVAALWVQVKHFLNVVQFHESIRQQLHVVHFWRPSTDRCTAAALHVQPRASRTEVAGVHGDALRIRVAAPPVEGEANQELLRFLAKKLHLPKSDLKLIHGESGRTKIIEIRNATRDQVVTALRAS
jgi:uncharacterized protein (TIGR00251 family)